MQIAVLGASGRAGAEITKEAAARGHAVRALARKPEAIPAGPGITPCAVDAHHAAELTAAIGGVEVVISALHFDVTAAALLASLRAAGVPRLLVTGGAASLETAAGQRLIDSPNFPEQWRSMAMEGVRLLEDLRAESAIDWTFFSPAALLFEGPRTGQFRTGTDRLLTDAAGESRISFADYAIAMVDELEQHRHPRARFTAAY